MTDDGPQTYSKNEKINVIKSEHTHTCIEANNDWLWSPNLQE